MKRLLFPLFVLAAFPGLQADPVQDVLDASPRLDAPGPGYGSRVFVPLELQRKPSENFSPSSAGPAAVDPWDKVSFLYESSPQVSPPPPNPAIDYEKFTKNVLEVGRLRERRRISEEEFLRLPAEPDTIVLDARSREKFLGLHIQGAKNLSLPDMTASELAKVIPSKTTRVLIYCNNNFEDLSGPPSSSQKATPLDTVGDGTAKPGSPDGGKGFVASRKGGDGPIFLRRKKSAAALNLYTFNTLVSYGYTNVYELGPLIDIRKTKLLFEGVPAFPEE